MFVRTATTSVRRAAGCGAVFTLAAGVLMLTAATPAGAQTRSGQVEHGGSGVCCLNNFRYTGTCEVTVGPGESCFDVLSYLNNVMSAGRLYCGNSLIRGGWTLVRCASAGPISAPEPLTVGATITMAPVATASLGTVSRTTATFITPIETPEAAPAAAPGLIDL